MSFLRRHIRTILRLALAAVFMLASIGKILHPQAFAQAVANYQILPDFLVAPVALLIPWLEMTAGLGLLSGTLVPGSLIVINGLLVVFTLAIGSSLVRGLDISCGCFDLSGDAQKATAVLLLRNAGLLAVGLWLLIAAMRPPLVQPSAKTARSRKRK